MNKNPSILILCISLEQSKDRRENIEKEIDKLKSLCTHTDIDFKFFNGIYGRDLAPQYLFY